jgi:hypothetical protein
VVFITYLMKKLMKKTDEQPIDSSQGELIVGRWPGTRAEVRDGLLARGPRGAELCH